MSKRLAIMACLLWLGTTPAMAAPPALAPGILLVACASLSDPRFHEAVVLVVQHGSKGTAGLILNRMSRLADWQMLPGAGQVPCGRITGGPRSSRATALPKRRPSGRVRQYKSRRPCASGR